jgi:hypothetical protein
MLTLFCHNIFFIWGPRETIANFFSDEKNILRYRIA